MKENMENTLSKRLDELSERLNKGVKQVFQSENYQNYLKTIARFHQYSVNNQILIWLQNPNATRVAGKNTWQKLGRTIKAGAKPIKIFRPQINKYNKLVPEIDPITKEELFDKNGNRKMVQKEFQSVSYYSGLVFDISSTEGKELPKHDIHELKGDVIHYGKLLKSLIDTSPAPITFVNLSNGVKGHYLVKDNKIEINSGMGQIQTIKTIIHERAHAELHNSEKKKERNFDKRTREVQAESVAYLMCQILGIDTSEYSFGYIAEWSSGKDIKELKNSLELIRLTVRKFVEQLEPTLQNIAQEKENLNIHNQRIF